MREAIRIAYDEIEAEGGFIPLKISSEPIEQCANWYGLAQRYMFLEFDGQGIEWLYAEVMLAGRAEIDALIALGEKILEDHTEH